VFQREAIHSTDAPAASGGYSPAIRLGNWVFVSGQGPIDSVTGSVVGTTIEEQTVATLRNVEAILRSSGGDLTDVVKVTAFLKDLGEFARYDDAYRELMPDPLPARTTVGADVGDILIEVDAIAFLSDR
jgi:2-iminobutanoate/2-iminopropanoate deaminase